MTSTNRVVRVSRRSSSIIISLHDSNTIHESIRYDNGGTVPTYSSVPVLHCTGFLSTVRYRPSVPARLPYSLRTVRND